MCRKLRLAVGRMTVHQAAHVVVQYPCLYGVFVFGRNPLPTADLHTFATGRYNLQPLVPC
jgi:hypothetical protein